MKSYLCYKFLIEYRDLLRVDLAFGIYYLLSEYTTKDLYIYDTHFFA